MQCVQRSRDARPCARSYVSTPPVMHHCTSLTPPERTNTHSTYTHSTSQFPATAPTPCHAPQPAVRRPLPARSLSPGHAAS